MNLYELLTSDPAFRELPEGKSLHPTQPNQAPFIAMERYLDVEQLPDGLEAVMDVRNLAIRKLEMLDHMHRDLIAKAHNIIEKAREDLRLHAIRMNATKVRNNVYYLYVRDSGRGEEFFSILEPDDYKDADPSSRFLGAYRLNEDSSWTRIE